MLNHLPVFGSNLDNIYPTFTWDEAQFALPSLEQQLQLCATATTYGTAIPLNPVPTSYENPSGLVAAPRLTPCQATSTIQEITENERLEASDSGAVIPSSPITVHDQSRGDQDISSRNSKHGQREKHFCPDPGCNRSRPGSGFCRKDHLDQHLRGRHKQNSVPRLRAKPAATSSARSPNATSETTRAHSQLNKRKRRSEGETGRHSGDGLFEELAEERRLRLLVEQDNQRLRWKLENHEERIRKCEERLDRLDE